MVSLRRGEHRRGVLHPLPQPVLHSEYQQLLPHYIQGVWGHSPHLVPDSERQPLMLPPGGAIESLFCSVSVVGPEPRSPVGAAAFQARE